jgi:hypothetical protein
MKTTEEGQALRLDARRQRCAARIAARRRRVTVDRQRKAAVGLAWTKGFRRKRDRA